MRRYFTAILLLPIAFFAIFLGCYCKLIQLSIQRVETTYNTIIANKCSDAATLELMDSADVSLDYENLENISVDPDVALYEYGVMLCLSKGIQPTLDSVDNILHDYVKILTVCAYDGYYVYQGARTENGMSLTGTPKLPYTYVDGGTKYALSLNGGPCWKFYYNDDGTPILKDRQDCPIKNKDLVNTYINKRISDDLNSRIKFMYDNGWTNKVYIPGAVSNISRVNPIQGPTVLAVQTSDSMDVSFGIGGTKLTQSRAIVGYTRDGIKYYAYSDLIPNNVAEVPFDSMAEAAKAGYCYDYQTMK